MKGRLVKDKNENRIFLCPNGDIAKVTNDFLHNLLFNFKDFDQFDWISQGTWKSEAVPSMEQYPGEVMAVVTDGGQLIIYDPDTFQSIVGDIQDVVDIQNYLSTVEYAKKHNASTEIVKVYCRAGRILGAFKNSSNNWMIPENAPFPVPPNRRKTNSGKRAKKDS